MDLPLMDAAVFLPRHQGSTQHSSLTIFAMIDEHVIVNWAPNCAELLYKHVVMSREKLQFIISKPKGSTENPIDEATSPGKAWCVRFRCIRRAICFPPHIFHLERSLCWIMFGSDVLRWNLYPFFFLLSPQVEHRAARGDMVIDNRH